MPYRQSPVSYSPLIIGFQLANRSFYDTLHIVILATYTKPEDAHLAVSLLAGNGIDAYIRDENVTSLHWLYSNAVGGVKVEVADEDFEQAMEVLNLPKGEGLLKCPHCQSDNVRIREMSLLSGICLALYLPLPCASQKVDCLDCEQWFALKQ